MAAEAAAWLSPLRRYLAASVLGHAAWEIFQLPLYTIWSDGTVGEIVFAVVHCTGGDLLIAATTLLLALIVFGRAWPDGDAYRNVMIAAVLLGVGYTIFSEWLNVSVRQSWTYSPWMPRLPILGTGLSPLAQWVVVPVLSFRWARARLRS
jgi:hypothetical protein